MVPNPGHAFERLIEIMEELRVKCPWDRKQTIHSLRQMTIEETYELTDAITENDWQGIKEELGDLLLHVAFYSVIGRENARFDINDVINGIIEKLINRHPHVYGDVQVSNADDVKRNWEQIKIKEGKTSVISGLPKGLPALIKAMRLQEKAKQVGFEWDNREAVWEKVEEETAELRDAVARNNPDDIEEEFGDLIFSLVNYARFLRIDAENALERTNKKFIYRFSQMESEANKSGKALSDMSLSEMDEIWNAVKARQTKS